MWLLLGALASAHEPGLSRVGVQEGQIVLQVARTDSSDPMSLLSGTHAALQGGEACEIGAPDVQPDDNGFIAKAKIRCPGSGEVTVTGGWFSQLPPGHRTVVDRDGVPAGFLDAAHPSFAATVQGATPRLEVAMAYLSLGIEHIVTGYDHLVFLFGLLVVARSLRDIAGVVTGFTLAHSLTLSLAALGWLTVPSSVVEPLIALSIVWVGLENLLDPPAKRRFFLTIGLGLVHGLGFAGLLREIGFPEGRLLLSLATFNLGVEIGQFGVVLLVLPALQLLRRAAWWGRFGQGGVSLAVASAGLFWFVTRVCGTLAS